MNMSVSEQLLNLLIGLTRPSISTIPGNASQEPAPSDKLYEVQTCLPEDRLGGIFLGNGDFVDVYRPRMLHAVYVDNSSRSPIEAAVTLLTLRCKVEGESRNAAYYLNLHMEDFSELHKLLNKPQSN